MAGSGFSRAIWVLVGICFGVPMIYMLGAGYVLLQPVPGANQTAWLDTRAQAMGMLNAVAGLFLSSFIAVLTIALLRTNERMADATNAIHNLEASIKEADRPRFNVDRPRSLELRPTDEGYLISFVFDAYNSGHKDSAIRGGYIEVADDQSSKGVGEVGIAGRTGAATDRMLRAGEFRTFEATGVLPVTFDPRGRQLIFRLVPVLDPATGSARIHLHQNPG